MNSSDVTRSQVADWKSLFEAALVEMNSTVLLDRIGAAREAIHSRMKQLETAKLSDETMKLLDALTTLDDLLRMHKRNSCPTEG